MRASQVLQKCLSGSFAVMHHARDMVLLYAVETAITGRRLILMDIARKRPDAERVRVTEGV